MEEPCTISNLANYMRKLINSASDDCNARKALEMSLYKRQTFIHN